MHGIAWEVPPRTFAPSDSDEDDDDVVVVESDGEEGSPGAPQPPSS